MNRFFLSLAVLFMMSCTRRETANMVEDVSSDSPVQITAITSSCTKGAIVEDAKDMGSIGLYCAMTGSGKWKSTTEFSKLDNQRYYTSSGEDWIIDGESVLWGFESLSDNYTFFAYSPYDEDTKGVTPRIDGGELKIDYTVAASSADQPDLMYAVPCKDIFPQASGCVPLTFHHALSCVSFSVVSTNDTRITAIDITGVVSSGSLEWNYTSNSPYWSLGELTDDSFSVAVEYYTMDSDNSVQVNTEQGYLMMIPQVLEGGAQVILTLDGEEQRSLMIPANSEWEAGLKYQYVINLDDESGFIYDSTQLSNCYIINPTAGEETIVQVPIEDRINDFWKNYSESETKKIKVNTDSTELSVAIVWEDFDEALQFSYIVLDDADKNMAARLTIPAKYQEGNLVFAVLKDDGDGGNDILWSWHLWFTDYNPDKIAAANRAKIEEGVDMKYTLNNYNGAVYRYADADGSSAVWSGIYSDKFIMDRNIGERNEYSASYGAGSVYYEFGRKDPFPGSGARYGSITSSLSIRNSSGFGFDQSVEFSYNYFISITGSSDNWCGETIARAATAIWYDENLLASEYSEGKSIFDPSPLGWRVPVSDTWSSFNTSDDEQTDCNTPTSLGTYDYYGCRDAENLATLSQSGEVGYVWSANQADYQSGYCFSYSDTQANSSTQLIVTYGLPIRSIEE